jgi:hypothetical protein
MTPQFLPKLRGPLEIKDKTAETTHEDVKLNKQHMKSPIVTSE